MMHKYFIVQLIHSHTGDVKQLYEPNPVAIVPAYHATVVGALQCIAETAIPNGFVPEIVDVFIELEPN